uniref:1-phosphatidylinositol 4-kinase n=1 Tax=Brassica campestris TaxID=3711 RepID=M4FHZ5_BRACM
MNDLQSQSDKMFMDKKVSACDLQEIVVCNCKEPTQIVVKDICVDEGVPMVHEKFLFNKEETVKLEDNKPEECADTKDAMELVVTGDEVGCEKPPPENVVAESESVSNKALTLRDIISMEDSNKPLNNVNTYEPEGGLGRDIEERKTVEKKSVSWRYLPSETVELENQRLSNVLVEDSYDHHHLFSSYEFGARSFSEAAEPGLAHITYSGPISISGSLSARSDGSTVSANSFAFPVSKAQTLIVKNPFSNGRSSLGKLEEEEEDETEEEAGLALSLSKLSTSKKDNKMGSIYLNTRRDETEKTLSSHKSANVLLPVSTNFVKLADMVEVEWVVFLEKFQELLDSAFAERQTMTLRSSQRLGTSCQF